VSKRYYRFSTKFVVERDVLIKADNLIDAIAKVNDVGIDSVLLEIDSSDVVFPARKQDRTQIYPERDYLYRADSEGDELDNEKLDDDDFV